MNIRRITQYLKLREQLTDDELRLAETFGSLSETERSLLVETLQPDKKPARKRRGKSQRAAGLANQLSNAIQRCTGTLNGELCGEPQGHAVHEDESRSGYHPFVSPATSAGKQSRQRSQPAQSSASTEGEKTSADTASSAGAGGD